MVRQGVIQCVNLLLHVTTPISPPPLPPRIKAGMVGDADVQSELSQHVSVISQLMMDETQPTVSHHLHLHPL